MRFGIIILALVFLKQCEGKPAESTRFLVSHPLPNQVEDHKYDHHGEHCVGFYKSHFDRSLLTPSCFRSGNLEYLEEQTGVGWQQLNTPDSLLHFTTMFEQNHNKVVYVAELVHVDQKEERILSLGSDEGVTVWLNGDSLHTNHTGRAITPNDDLIPVTLEEGDNVILYKVDHNSGEWGLLRSIKTHEEIAALIQKKPGVLYMDLPGTHIIEDDKNKLPLKRDDRRKLDGHHTINFTWHSGITQPEPIATLEITPRDLGDSLNIPIEWPGMGYLEMVVSYNRNPVYHEKWPVFTGTGYDAARSKLIPELSQNWKEVINIVNHAGEEYEANYPAFSTRWRTRLLADAMKTHSGLQGETGFIQNSRDMYRMFPTGSEKPADHAVVILHVDEQNRDHFLATHAGSSHALNADWQRYASRFGTAVVAPHIRLEESPELIADKVQSVLEEIGVTTATGIHLLVWSFGAEMVLELVQKMDSDIASIGVISPLIASQEHAVTRKLLEIRRKHPGVKWFVRHGLEDHDVPVYRAREFREQLEQLGFEVNYAEVPHSSHWNYLIDPAEEYVRFVQSFERGDVQHNNGKKEAAAMPYFLNGFNN